MSPFYRPVSLGDDPRTLGLTFLLEQLVPLGQAENLGFIKLDLF
jgi:hypothetical protein